MLNNTVRIFEPTSRVIRQEIPLANRSIELKGSIMGFLWNDKPNADFLLERFAELLSNKLGLADIIHRHKISAGEPAPAEIIEDLSARCNSVIVASGDCGSCTSYVIHDAIELEKRGVPAVAVCTNEFSELGRVEAVALNMPDVPILEVPHPLGGITKDAVRVKADESVDDLMILLRMSKQELYYRAKEQHDT